MKIGILTFHCAHNYGAVLQAYSLKEYLKSEGHDTYIIDYRPNFLTKTRDYLRFSLRILFTRDLKLLPKIFISGLRLAKKRNRRWERFNHFITKELNLYKADGNFKGEGFDLCLVGSDQIWNKKITGGVFDPLYFGKDFVCPVASYAASTITKDLSPDDRTDLKQLLNGLTAISVREDNLRNQLVKITNRKIDVVIDPTLLADETIFDKFHTCIRNNIRKPYLLIYTIKEYPALYKKAQEIAAKEGLEIVEISSTFNLKRHHQKLYDVGIEEYVGLFKNAKFILTNSFHGTAFSIILRKDFYSVRQNLPQDERIKNILNQLHLNDRFSDIENIHAATGVDYTDVENHLWEYRNQSRKYLSNIISQS